MEGIVAGIAQIDFHQSFNGLTSENSDQNFVKRPSIIMSGSESPTSEEPTNSHQEDGDNTTLNKLSEVDSITDGGWEDIKDNLEKDIENKIGYTFAERRQMPSRSSKESSILGIKRRSIIKPTKRTRNHEDVQNLKPSDIKKIYLNQRLTKFKPSSLETIFEETSTICNNEQNCSRFMGGRKIKRSLSFSNGFRCSKTLLNKRRAKIKKTFGKRFALKKISLEEFITKLNTNIDKDENALNNDCQMEDDKCEIVQENSHSEKLASNASKNLDDLKTDHPSATANASIDRNENFCNNDCKMEDKGETVQENSHFEILASNACENLHDTRNLPSTTLSYAFPSTTSLS